MKWRDSRNSHLEQESSSIPKVKTQTDEKSLNSLKASPVTKAQKFLVCGGQDEKDRRVIIDIIPCVVVTSLETDAFVAIVAFIDVVKVRSNLSARSKRRYSRISCYSENKKKTSKGCVSQSSDPMNTILRKVEELLRRDTSEILRMHLVQN